MHDPVRLRTCLLEVLVLQGVTNAQSLLGTQSQLLAADAFLFFDASHESISVVADGEKSHGYTPRGIAATNTSCTDHVA